MAFTLYSLIQTAILCTNAIAVLHEERFLSKSEYYTTQLHEHNNKQQKAASCKQLAAAAGVGCKIPSPRHIRAEFNLEMIVEVKDPKIQVITSLSSDRVAPAALE